MKLINKIIMWRWTPSTAIKDTHVTRDCLQHGTQNTEWPTFTLLIFTSSHKSLNKTYSAVATYYSPEYVLRRQFSSIMCRKSKWLEMADVQKALSAWPNWKPKSHTCKDARRHTHSLSAQTEDILDIHVLRKTLAPALDWSGRSEQFSFWHRTLLSVGKFRGKTNMYTYTLHILQFH